MSASGYKPKSGPRRRYDRSTPSNRHSSAEVRFRPDFVGCTPRCGLAGRRCRWSGGDPQQTLTGAWRNPFQASSLGDRYYWQPLCNPAFDRRGNCVS